MYYFIVNPNASSGKGKKIWDELSKKLLEEEISYKVYFTKGPGHATRIAGKLCAQHAAHASSVCTESTCTIVAVGGDGTANEVINGLCNYPFIRFGYIPTGSGNDLARGLLLPSAPDAALSSILHPSSFRNIHIGCSRIDGRNFHFAVSTGIGFDAAVCHEAVHSKIKRLLNRFGLGKLTYLGIALKQLMLLRPFPVTVVLDGGAPMHFSQIYFAAVMNLKYEGGGFMFCPDALPEDEYLDICLVEKMSKLKILFLLPTAFFGHHTHYKGIHIMRCRSAAFLADLPQAIHTDGEAVATASSMEISLSEKKLPFIVG